MSKEIIGQKFPDSKYQVAIFEAILFKECNVAIQATAGCLHPDTKILMFNGSIKLASEIIIGDLLMGPDSKSRKVLNIANGDDELYEIIPQKGEKWICNSKHLLTVHNEQIARNIKIYKVTKHITPLQDLPLKKLIDKSKSTITKGIKSDFISNYRLQRVGVDFENKKTNIPPYLMGLWLGDGTKDAPSITSKDQEIIDYCKSIDLKNITCKVTPDDNCFTIRLTTLNHSKNKNILREEIKTAIINDEKRIPKSYLINSKGVRAELLAGLIDSDGYLGRNNYEIASKYKGLAEDIVFLCRSLGLAAYSSYKRKTIKKLNFEGWYWTISISGELDNIPVLLKRKKATKRKQIKSVLRTGFKINPIGNGKWNGFQVDKDNRFLLGDFTITHNSGKTTTIVKASKMIDPKKESLFAAFGKAIVDELSEKLPKNVMCSTMHSIGMTALMSHFRTNFRINEFKSFPFIEEVLKKKPVIAAKDELEQKAIIKQQMNYRFQMRDALDLVRMTMTPLNIDALFNMCVHYDIDLLVTEMEDVITVLKKMEIYNRSFTKKHNYLDYTDMIFLPVTNPKVKLPQFDFVFLDEAQDMNLAQQSLVERLLKPKGRLISVGDKRQAIYSFAGADMHSFERFEQRPNTISLPLSISYRLPITGAELAKTIYPEIEPCLTNIQGEVRYGTVDEIVSGDMVLCRNNRPLTVLYFKLLRMERNPVLYGSEIQTGLEALISKESKKSVEDGIESLYGRLDLVEKELKEKGIKNIKEHPKYESLKDKILTIEIIGERFSTMKEVLKEVGEMFKEKENCIKLMTIHGSKGKENDRVFYIERFEGKKMLPSPMALKDWELVQEENLKFVMCTRHKKSLIFIQNLK